MKKSIQIFMVIVLAGCLSVIAGCEGAGVDGSDAAATLEGTDAASLSFRMEWVDNPAPLTLAAAVKLSDDCSGRGVVNVRISVRDSSGASLKSATFACSVRQGTLAGVTPGSNRTIRVSGLNSGGTETWRGEKTGVTLVAGTNNIGTIQVERVNNQSPTAAITSPSNNSSFTSGQSITFTGTGTDSEDGTLSSSAFVWTSNRDGQIKTGQKSFSTSALSVGTHTITLTVTDSDGATGSKSRTITITGSNQSPTAAITSPVNNRVFNTGQSITFTGAGTDPEDGALPASAFVWRSSRDGQINSGSKSFTRSNLSAGTHTITLTVTDGSGTGSASIAITINQLPVAAITSPSDYSSYEAEDIFYQGDIVTFTGTGTDPEDGTLDAAVFVWTSSLSGRIQSGRKSFSTDSLGVGTHVITLKVTDSSGATGSASITVNMVPAGSLYVGDTLSSVCVQCEGHDPGHINRGCGDNMTTCHPFDYEDFGRCVDAALPSSYCQTSWEYFNFHRAIFELCDCFPALRIGDSIYITMEIVIDKGRWPMVGDNGVYWAEDVGLGIPAEAFRSQSDVCNDAKCTPANRFTGEYFYRLANGNIGTPYNGSTCVVADNNRVVKIEPNAGKTGINDGLQLIEAGKCVLWIDIPRMRVDPTRVLPGWHVYVRVCIDDDSFFTGGFHDDCCGLIYIGELCCDQ